MKRIAVWAMGILTGAGLQAALIDFNTTGDLTNNFTWATAAQYSEAVANGVAGSGRVAVGTTPNVEATYNTATIFDEVGDSITTSIDFKWDSINGNGSTRFLMLGFSASPGDRIDSYSTVALDALVGTTDDVRLESGIAGFFSNGPTVTLSDGNWYRLEATFERIAPTASDPRFTFSLDLLSLGVSGTDSPASLATHSQSLNSAALAEVSIYQQFTASQAYAGGTTSLDNFQTSIIPEPASLGLIVVGALGTLLVRALYLRN